MWSPHPITGPKCVHVGCIPTFAQIHEDYWDPAKGRGYEEGIRVV